MALPIYSSARAAYDGFMGTIEPSTEESGSAEEIAASLSDIFPRMMISVSRLGGNRSVSKLPLTVPQLRALYALQTFGKPVQMTEFASELGVTQSTATDVTKRLVRMGYMAKKRLAGDKRVVCVSLSGKGKKIVQQMRSEKFQQFLAICKALSKADRMQLLKGHQLILNIYSSM